jgi:hypothetical protein
MNVETGTEAAQFPEKEYINRICSVSGWLCSTVGCQAFEAVPRRTATSNLHDGLPGGIVQC